MALRYIPFILEVWADWKYKKKSLAAPHIILKVEMMNDKESMKLDKYESVPQVIR